LFRTAANEDLDFADQLVIGLEFAGFSPKMDRGGISGGEDWKLRLGSLIREADTIVFVLSPASADSSMCWWEVLEAKRLGKRIIPVLCGPPQAHIAPDVLQDLNARPGAEPGRERLAIPTPKLALKPRLRNLRGHRRREPKQKIIDVFVCKARKKIVQASGGRDYIETVRGRGYMLRQPKAMKSAS
jgi:hypothetical protein